MCSVSGGLDLDRAKLGGKRDRSGSSTCLEIENCREVKMARSMGERRIVFRLKEQTGDGFRAMNPLKIADSLKCLGENVKAQVVPSGALFVFCSTPEQILKAQKLTKICGKKVEVAITDQSNVIKGVVYGVFADMTEKEIKDNVVGGDVVEVKRFKVREGGNPCAPVLLSFKGDKLPLRVFLGCLSYLVKPYLRPPLRCFKCQRFGHVAIACRGNRRCLKCGGNHDVASCDVSALKCCNCGGCHMASSKECGFFIKARRVQDVREQHNLSYAEAVRRVNVDVPTRVSVTSPASRSLLAGSPSTVGAEAVNLVVGKEALLAFIVDVVYGTRGKKSRSDIIKFVSESATRFLGVGDFAPQSLHEFMKAGQGCSSEREVDREGDCSVEGMFVEDMDGV